MRSRAAGEGVLAADLRVTVHFQPDLPVGGADVAAALAREGVYRSQVWHYLARFGREGDRIGR